MSITRFGKWLAAIGGALASLGLILAGLAVNIGPGDMHDILLYAGLLFTAVAAFLAHHGLAPEKGEKE